MSSIAPVKVYLDYNVIVDISKGSTSLDEIKKVIGTSNVVFPYSITHINEIRKIEDRPGKPAAIEIKKMLEIIDKISRKQYLERIRYDLPYKKRSLSASVVNSTFHPKADAIQGIIDSMLSIQSEATKQNYRTQLNLDTNELNNITTDEIIGHLNIKMQQNGDTGTYLELQRLAEKHYPNGDFGVESDIVGLFVFLDLMGYWKDKVTETSHVARFWDGSHSAHATFCDILISTDKRMRMKSEVAFKFFGHNTKILSPQG